MNNKKFTTFRYGDSMKTKVDCETVFELLTHWHDGPTTDRDAIALHLEECTDCGRFAESCQPAFDVLDEASHKGGGALGLESEVENQPDRAATERRVAGIMSSVRAIDRMEPTTRVANNTSSAVSNGQAFQTQRTAAGSKWLFALLTIAGGMLLFAFYGPQRTNQPPSTETFLTGIGVPSPCVLLVCNTDSGTLAKASQSNNAESNNAESNSEIHNSQYDCCTECHAKGKPTLVSHGKRPILANSCLACHTAIHP